MEYLKQVANELTMINILAAVAGNDQCEIFKGAMRAREILHKNGCLNLSKPDGSFYKQDLSDLNE